MLLSHAAVHQHGRFLKLEMLWRHMQTTNDDVSRSGCEAQFLELFPDSRQIRRLILLCNGWFTSGNTGRLWRFLDGGRTRSDIRIRYHDCIGHIGTTVTPVTFSWVICWRTLRTQLRGGKQYNCLSAHDAVNASTKDALGSGLKEQWKTVCLDWMQRGLFLVWN